MKKQWIYRLLMSVLLCCTLSGVYAQQDAHYSQYIFNGLVLNPAYAGSRGTLAANLFYRNQWVGFEGAPVTQTVSVHSPISHNRYGVGISFSNDKIGYVNQQWLTGSYAFRIRLPRADLSLGLSGGLLNYRLNWQEAQVADQNDAVLMNQQQNFLLPNVGTGIYFSSRKFYAGLSMPHILNSELINANSSVQEVSRLYRHVFFTTGVVLGKSIDFKFKPSVLVKYVPGAPVQADLNAMFLLKQKYWVGMGYRSEDALTFMFDFQVNRLFRLGYAYDYTLSPLNNYQSGSHEVVLGFELGRKNEKIKSPRYF